MEILTYLEQTALATFIRESSSYLGFPTFLFMHTLGLSILVGANSVVAIRVLGVASSIPLKPMERLFPFMWAGFILTVISGLGLGIAAATTRLINPILLFKLVLIAIATPIMRMMEKRVFRSASGLKEVNPQAGKAMAAALLVLWTIIMIAGRLIAYSATILGGGH
jgi:hypothetical protein